MRKYLEVAAVSLLFVWVVMTWIIAIPFLADEAIEEFKLFKKEYLDLVREILNE